MTPAITIRRKQVRHPRTNGECGAAMIETALSAIVFLTVIFGIFEACLAVYSYHYISEVAREATRYAIVRGSSLGVDCAAPTYATCIAQGGSNNAGDIATYVQNIGFPGIVANNITVNSTWLTSTGAACGTADSCKAPGNQVQVNVQYLFPLVIPFIPTTNVTMSSTSQMVISN